MHPLRHEGRKGAWKLHFAVILTFLKIQSPYFSQREAEANCVEGVLVGSRVLIFGL